MLTRWLMMGPCYALSLNGDVRDRQHACQDSYDLNPERNHKLTYNILWGAEEALSKYVLWTCAQPCQGPWLRPRGYWQSFPKVKAPRNGKAILWSVRKCWECLQIWVFTNDQPDRSKASNCSCLLLGVQGYRLLPSVMFIIVAGTEVWVSLRAGATPPECPQPTWPHLFCRWYLSFHPPLLPQSGFANFFS